MRVLADTSVWIDHFRFGQERLAEWLVTRKVLMHPYIYGELACGNFINRAKTLAYLSALPAADVALDDEVLLLIEGRKLWNRGLGWVDVHLLASAHLSGARLWTLDKQLLKAAADLNVHLHLS